jgi:hypothetical protein
VSPARSLSYALRLLELGYGPVPIHNKRPLVKWRDYHLLRKVGEAEVREWFTTFPDASIALLTGWQYDLVVVDTDTPEAEAWATAVLPPTPRVVATRRGFHRYYRHPGLETRSRPFEFAPGVTVDIKGDRAQCTAPGSIHPSGHVYRATRRWSKLDRVPILPGVVAKVACVFALGTAGRETPTRPRPDWPDADGLTRLRQYLAKHPIPEIGCGSDRATFSAAVFARSVDCGEEAFVCEVVHRYGFDERWVRTKWRAGSRYARPA